MADFLGEGVIGVLERAHHGSVNADVEDFETVGIASGIEKAIDGIGVRTLGGSKADYGAIGFGHDAGSIGRVVEKLGSFAGELGVEFTGKSFAGKFGGCVRTPLGAFF